MKRLLFAAALLLTAIYTQAQSEKSMNTLAEEYANSSEGRLCFIEPETAVITRDDTGYSIEVTGTRNGYAYCITSRCSQTPLQQISISSGNIEVDLSDDVTIVAPDSVVLSKNAEHSTVTVEGRNGDETYFLKISLNKATNNTLTVKETDNGWDFNIPFIENTNENSSEAPALFSFNILDDLEFGIGLVSATGQADDMNVKMGNAGMEFILNNLFNWRFQPTRNTHFTLGFGVDWRNYRMKGDRRFLKDGDNLLVAPYPDGADINFSRIKVFSMTLELMLKQRIYKGIYLHVGPVVNFNTHASIKTRYSVGSGKDKERFKETSSDICQNPVTVDFKGQLNFKNIGFYFKYSPTNTLDTDWGPEFKSISTGIVIRLGHVDKK